MLPVLLACCMPAFAQNINQSVQVTNEYETKFADFRKLEVKSELPDSLYDFDYSFDYSVFDSPYRGSYEFTPYEIRITPDPMAYDGSRFLLRAGAGYTLRPVLDLYWTAVRRNDFTLGLSNAGRGYYGRYSSRPGTSGAVLDGFDGYDFSDSFGVSGHYVMRGADLRFDAGYDGIFTGDGFVNSAYNSAYAGVRLSSAEKSKTYFAYDIGVAYRFGADDMNPVAPEAAALAGRESNLLVDGSFGPVINGKYAFSLDFSFESERLARPAGYADMVASHAILTPHVSFRQGVFSIDAGVDIDYLGGAASNSFQFAPAVDVSVLMFSGSTRAFAGLSGGRSVLDMHTLKSVSHFYSPTESSPSTMREAFGAYVGIEGRIGRSFQYAARGGYSSLDGMPLEYLRRIGFADADFVYAGLDFKWVSRRLDVDGGFGWNHAVKHSAAQVFAPSEFAGDISVRYSWLGRIHAGLSLEGASERRAMDSSAVTVPGYLDLGISGEYMFSSRFGAWARLGNLLGMDIERNPGYVIPGPHFTVGAVLKL